MTRELIGVLSRDDDRAAVHIERRYATDAADLWSILTEPERVARWFAPVTGDLREGGAYEVAFGDGDVCRGVIERCEPPKRLELTWQIGDEPVSRVAAEVHPDGMHALLVLDHTRIDDEDILQYGPGWQTYLERVDTLLTGEAFRDFGERFDELTPGYRRAATEIGAPA